MRWSRLSELGLALALATAWSPPDSLAQSGGSSGPGQSNHGCSFQVLAGFYFGSYDDGATSSVYTTATFQLKCTGIGNSAVALSAGPSSVTGDFGNRRMRGPPGSELRYQLFANSSRTVVWGDGSRDTSPIVIQQNGAYKQATAYGELFGGQSGEQGDYGDTIVVTVSP